jgi:hypothetical protein
MALGPAVATVTVMAVNPATGAFRLWLNQKYPLGSIKDNGLFRQ